MKILFVVGGSYKAFYINNLKHYQQVDLLVFQENILYDFDYYNELCGLGTVTNEMIALSKRLNCCIIANVNTNLCGQINKEILFCDNNGVKLISADRYIRLIFNSRSVVCSLYDILPIKCDLSIQIAKNSQNIHLIKNTNKKRILFCDKYGVIYLNKGKFHKKNRKICYFSLKF